MVRVSVLPNDKSHGKLARTQETYVTRFATFANYPGVTLKLNNVANAVQKPILPRETLGRVASPVRVLTKSKYAPPRDVAVVRSKCTAVQNFPAESSAL